MRIQFYAPHPDDIELFCGGSLLRHYSEQDAIQALIMTRGEAGTISPRMRGKRLEAIRIEEANRRYRLVPRVELIWLPFRDGKVRLSPSAVETLRTRIAAYHPDMIYLPESQYGRSLYKHPDHIHAGRIVEAAASSVGWPMVLRYYHSRCANRLINIDPYFEANRAALHLYRSQYGVSALPPFHLYVLEAARAYYLRKRGRRIGCKYAEGFREVSEAPEAC